MDNDATATRTFTIQDLRRGMRGCSMVGLTVAGTCLLLMVLILARRVHALECDVDGWRAHVSDLYGDIEDLKAAVYGEETP